jgi:hypothetical protein
MPKLPVRRALIGLAVAVLTTTVVATPAEANPKPVTPSKAQPNGAVPGGFSNWNAVYAFQTRLNAAAERILAAGGAGTASIVAGPENRELRVYWPGEVPAAVRKLADGLDVPVVFLPARFTHRELVDQARRLAADPRVAQAAPEADGSGLAVTVTGQLGQSDRAGLQAGTTVPLTITVGPRQQVASRQADTPPFWGGSAYEDGFIGCSNGFPIRFGDVYRMIVAAHCVVDGDHVSIPNRSGTAGTVSSSSGCRDTALIDYPSGLAPRIYTGPPNSSTSVEVLGATSDFVGNLVATGGAVSGEHLNIPVRAVDVFTNLNGVSSCAPGRYGPFTQAAYQTATCAITSGDSGGPVYSYVGSNVLARGTITSGSSGTATCNGDTQGSRTVTYAPLFRPAGDPQVGSLDFYRAAPPPATIFNLSGRWIAAGTTGPFISVNETTISVDMSMFGRPTAHGSVVDSSTISVTFPDDATYTGTLLPDLSIRWSNGTTWLKGARSTIFDLNGKWTGGTGPGPFISVNANDISVDMSAFGRPTAHGSVIDSSTISVTFPDDRTNTGRLLSPNSILWSDNTLWTKI